VIFNQIDLFVTVAKYRNLGKAARQMRVSVASVSQRLKALENEVGAKLYTKRKHGIEVTDAGQRLLKTATDVLERLEQVRRALSRRRAENSVESLSIGGTYNPAGKYLPLAIMLFQKTHPEVKLTFLTSDRRTMEEWLRKSEVEIAVIQTQEGPESPDFVMEHFAVDDLTFFAHPAHALAKKKKISVADLLQTPIIVREGGMAADEKLKELENDGIKLNVVMRCATPYAVKAAVRTNMGVGLLFRNVIEDEIKTKELKPLRISGLPTLRGSSYIVYCKNKPLCRAATEFLHLLRSMKAGLQRRATSSQTKQKRTVTA
jgi:DNA-binding transcriptional LysR family regulator